MKNDPKLDYSGPCPEIKKGLDMLKNDKIPLHKAVSMSMLKNKKSSTKKDGKY